MPDNAEALPQHILLDACCVINLYASGRMGDILQAHQSVFVVADYVLKNEALRVYSGPPGHVTEQTEDVQLEDLTEGDLIRVVVLQSGHETETYVEYSAHIDDGEAITGAMATNRNWSIATDDRKAASFFRNVGSDIKLVSTPELIKHWVDEMDPSADDLSEVLRNVTLRARYKPGFDHPLHRWWKEASRTEESI